MRAGELKEQVTIQSNTSAADSKGVYVNSWGTLAPDRAKIEAQSGTQDGQEIAGGEVIYTMTIRYRSDVSRENRILWGSKYLDIISAISDPYKRELVLQCKETSQ